MKRIIIFGGAGQLGRSLLKVFPEAIPYYHSSYIFNNADITDIERLKKIFSSEEPEIIFNATAFTNVDLSESEKEIAFAVNSIGVRNLAFLCREYSAKLIHFSTDYVFSGLSGLYKEEAFPDPINYYGFSKSVGDAYALSLDSSLVIRTSGLFGYGKNFPIFVYDRLKEMQTVNVIEGFYSPITSDLLSQSVKYLIENKVNISGILNIAGDRISRFQLSKVIAETFSLDSSGVRQVSSLTNLKAPRPYDSSLNITKAKSIIDFDFHSIIANMKSFHLMLESSQH